MAHSEPSVITPNSGVFEGSPDACAIHGHPSKRSRCKQCNSAYMRAYLRRRRRQQPQEELVRRARDRAAKSGIEFDLRVTPLLPARCPVLGILLTPGGRRRQTSPSLDRIDPAKGYVDGNVRVISDRANRLKGNRSAAEAQALSVVGAADRRADFALIALYLEREALLMDVRRRVLDGPGNRGEWKKVAEFLNHAFTHGWAVTRQNRDQNNDETYHE